MRKKISITFLIAITLLLISTFITSKIKPVYDVSDKFGFPFVFFTAQTNAENIETTSLSLTGLVCDFAIYFSMAYAIATMFSLLKIEKKQSRFIHTTN